MQVMKDIGGVELPQTLADFSGRKAPAEVPQPAATPASP